MSRPVHGLRPGADLARLAQARSAVVVPARDEAALVGRCLAALAAQSGARRLRPAVILVVNNSSDATARVAEAAGRDAGLPLAVVERPRLPGGVGAARRLGFAAAARLAPRARRILSTDADGAAGPGWLAAMCAAVDATGVAWSRIRPFACEAGRLPPRLQEHRRLEEAWTRLAEAFETLAGPGPAPALPLNIAGGASLGFAPAAYRAAGGFRRVPSGEDRDILARLVSAGWRPVRAPEAVMRVSLRADGRAPGGMAAALAEGLEAADAPLDSALEPFEAMLARRLLPDAAREPAPLRASRARRDLPALAACLEALRRLPSPEARLAYMARLYVSRAAARPLPAEPVPGDAPVPPAPGLSVPPAPPPPSPASGRRTPP